MKVPAGDPGTISDATGPLRWLVGHWKDITPAQRTAAIRLVPSLSALRAKASTDGTRAGTSSRIVLMGTSAQRRSNFFYTHYAAELATTIAAKVGRTLGIPIVARVATTESPAAYAETGVYTSSGGYEGAPGTCVITVSPSGDNLSGDDLDMVLAHEVWHCFQGAIIGLDGFWSAARPSWIIEGQAEWVGTNLTPAAALDGDFWPPYLSAPGTSLFARSYDAVGFYDQLGSSGTDVWTKLIPILLASSNPAAFQVSGAGSDAFLNAWASGYFRMPERGQAWDITGPGVTSTEAPIQFMDVGDGSSEHASAPAYADAVYGIASDSAEVLEFSFSGHARVSDGSGHDYLIQGDTDACHRSGGCECPDASSDQVPLLPLEGGRVALALSGDPSGDSGSVTGMSLKEFCTPNLTGVWKGRWSARGGSVGGAFVLHLKQTGQTLAGSIDIVDRGCSDQSVSSHSVPVTGSVAGSSIKLSVFNKIKLSGTLKGVTLTGTFGPSCDGEMGTWNVKR